MVRLNRFNKEYEKKWNKKERDVLKLRQNLNEVVNSDGLHGQRNAIRFKMNKAKEKKNWSSFYFLIMFFSFITTVKM